MPATLDDDSIPANARVWDFTMPPKSCSGLPLSSENPDRNLLNRQKTDHAEAKGAILLGRDRRARRIA
jgi:hypothetical protein